MPFSLRFGEITLDGCHVLNGAMSFRIPEYRVARRPGTMAPRVPAEENKVIALQGDLWKDSEAQVKQYFQLLGKKLLAGVDRLYIRDDDVYVNAVARSFQWSFVAQEVPTNHAKYSLDFYADDPHFYAPAQSEQAETVGAANTLTFSVTNSGGSRTPVVIEIRRTGTSNEQDDVRLEHTTTGLFMQWAGTLLPVGSSVIFDSTNQKVTALGGKGENDFTGSIRLQLEPGLNNFLYTGPGDVDILLAWIERWGLS